MKCFVIIAFILFGGSLCLNPCGDWVQYKDSKCLKVVEKEVTEEEAIKECQNLSKDSVLLTIHSSDEQNFVNNLLIKYKNISNNVWIALKFIDNWFRWTDGSIVDYSNWSVESAHKGEVKCAGISLETEDLGKWKDVSCSDKALIVCQKKQNIDSDVLRKAIESVEQKLAKLNQDFQQITNKQNTDLAVVLRNASDNIEKRVTELETKLSKITEPIPIGFIYTQLPNQSDPSKIWPQFQWTEVTQQYSGYFFRAEGGQSSAFGTKQSDNAPRLVSVINNYGQGSDVRLNTNMTLNAGEESKKLLIASDGGGTNIALSFHISGGEVRPINMAVRLWTRTK